MTDAKELLSERLQYHLSDVIGGDPDWDDFASRLADEIGLPDYEAAVEALEWLDTAAEELNRLLNGLDLEKRTIIAPSIRQAQEAVLRESRRGRAALRHLKEAVPA